MFACLHLTFEHYQMLIRGKYSTYIPAYCLYSTYTKVSAFWKRYFTWNANKFLTYVWVFLSTLVHETAPPPKKGQKNIVQHQGTTISPRPQDTVALRFPQKELMQQKKKILFGKKPRWHPGWIAKHLFLPGNNKRRCGFYDSPMRIRASSKEEEVEGGGGTGKAPWEKNSCS